MLDFEGQGHKLDLQGQGFFHKSKLAQNWLVMASRRTSCERKKVHHHPSLLHPPPPKKDQGQEDPKVKIDLMKGPGEGVWEVWAS